MKVNFNNRRISRWLQTSESSCHRNEVHLKVIPPSPAIFTCKFPWFVQLDEMKINALSIQLKILN